MTFFTCMFFKHMAGPLINSVSFERGVCSGVLELQRNLALNLTRIASYSKSFRASLSPIP